MRIINGKCEEVLKTLSDNSVDAVVCDPPYELGFMGKGWDSTGIAYSIPMWREVLRVLKPGGHLLSFGGTRTYHRMACAIEDAGFEIRDQIQWIYGQGFPKSLDVSKAIDKSVGAVRKPTGRTKPGHEGFDKGSMTSVQSLKGTLGGDGGFARPWMDDPEKVAAYHQETAPATEDAEKWSGWGTALKPANEPIVLARKPLSEKTVVANVLKWGPGALNIDGTRISYDSDAKDPATNPLYRKNNGYKNTNAPDIGSSSYQVKDGSGERNPNKQGRFPANVIHDGSDEVLKTFPDAVGQIAKASNNGTKSASRFFYCAKVSPSERDSSIHPTMKPLALIEYLIKLVTPPGGVVMDHFSGSGTTAVAAKRLGFGAGFIGIEQSAEYVEIIKKRMEDEDKNLLGDLI